MATDVGRVQLWRHLRRLESRLKERGGAGYYTQADLDAQWERVRHYDFSSAIAMEAASAGETEGLDGNRDSAGLKGIAQPSGLTKGDTDHE
jgi:hypothetical protein